MLAISCGSHSPLDEYKVKVKIEHEDTPKVSSPAVEVVKKPVPKILPFPRRFIVDLNNDHLADTITLTTALTSVTWDSVYFDTIHIAIAHYSTQTFFTDTVNRWTTMDDWFNNSSNVVPTKWFYLAKGKSQSVLLLFGGMDGAGYRGNFSIINIENNTSRLVLNQNERKIYIENAISLSDLDGDGRLDFLYRQIFEYNGKPDTLDGKVGTYSPFFIYTVDSYCVLNKPLTIRYNKKHYVFAGFNYDESIEVFYPNDESQPRLWKHKFAPGSER